MSLSGLRLAPQLQANFIYHNEFVFETPSVAERRGERSRGRLKIGHRRRTVPYAEVPTFELLT